MKRKYFSVFLIIAMICSLLMPFTTSADELTERTFDYDGFSVNYNVVSGWADNQNIQITVSNTGNEIIRNWALQYNPCGTVTGIWNGEVYGENIIKNANYNSDIEAGASVIFGYTLANANGAPDSFKLCSSREEKTDGFTVGLSVQNSWDSGFSGLLKISNDTDKPIMAWELSFDSNFSIVQTENFKIIEESENGYKICGTYNGNIPAFSNIEMAFNGSFSESPEISNENLSEMIIREIPVLDEPDSYIYFKDIESDDEVDYDGNGIFFVRNQILLTANDGVQFGTVSSLAAEYGAEIVGYIELTNDYQIEFKNDVTADYLYQTIDELMRNPLVEFASLNTAFILSDEADTIINDPISSVNLDKETITDDNWNLYAINADSAWQNFYSQMNPVKIGLYDSMFDKGHDDLNFKEVWDNPNLANEPDEIVRTHGTRVAGVMAATFDNGIGISGVSPQNELYAYSCSGPSTFDDNMMKHKYGFALLVSNNVRVINYSRAHEPGIAYAASINALVPNSASGKTVRSAISGNSDIFDKFLTKLINSGYDFTIVAAAGNDNGKYYIADPSKTYGYRLATNAESAGLTPYNNIDAQYGSILTGIPTTSKAYKRIIVAGAIQNGSSYSLGSFSNVGNRVDVVAPGQAITTTDVNNGYTDGARVRGTSFAAPHVSGVAGMMYSVNPGITAEQVRDEIIASGAGNLISTYPLVNANNAVAHAAGYSGNYEEKTNGILMGKVVEKGTENALSNVYVSINGATKEKLELNSGYFELILPAGTYKIEFIKEQDDDPLTVSANDYERLTVNNIVLAENEVKYIKNITMVKVNPNCFVNFNVKNATNNRAISGATIKYRKNWGETTGAYLIDAATGTDIIDTTNASGRLAKARELPGGYYTAEISLNGYITGYEDIAVSSINSGLPDMITALLCPVLSANECRIVLEWGATPSDLDSHLSGGGMHIYFGAKSYLNIASLDVDDTTSYGPETITLFTEKDGTYRYSIHDYTNRFSVTSSTLSSSGATVRFYYMDNGTETLAEYFVPSGSVGNVWNVLSFDVKNKVIDVSSITVLNTFKYQSNTSLVN